MIWLGEADRLVTTLTGLLAMILHFIKPDSHDVLQSDLNWRIRALSKGQK